MRGKSSSDRKTDTVIALYRIKVFPTWRDMYHFDSVMNVTFNDGKKHEDLSKVHNIDSIYACLIK